MSGRASKGFNKHHDMPQALEISIKFHPSYHANNGANSEPDHARKQYTSAGVATEIGPTEQAALQNLARNARGVVVQAVKLRKDGPDVGIGHTQRRVASGPVPCLSCRQRKEQAHWLGPIVYGGAAGTSEPEDSFYVHGDHGGTDALVERVQDREYRRLMLYIKIINHTGSGIRKYPAEGDTGAGVNVIGQKLVKELRLPLDTKLTNKAPKMQPFGLHPISFIGRVVVPADLQADGTFGTVVFWVLPDEEIPFELKIVLGIRTMRGLGLWLRSSQSVSPGRKLPIEALQEG